MQNGICPKCGSNEVLGNLRIRGGEGYLPCVNIHKPEPEKYPLVWILEFEQRHFRVDICGYTESYVENYMALNEVRKKGYIRS